MTYADASTPLTPSLREEFEEALVEMVGEDSMFSVGAAGYLDTLHSTPDGAPVGDLEDVAQILGWND